ncbi:MAG: NAD-dependent protein deacylase [Candidatus Thermoplasmatota archaeon]
MVYKEEETLTKCCRDIAKTKNIVALTGAGISTESGIPPFRGKKGLWEKYDPIEYGHISSFKKNPKKSWKMLREMITTIEQAKPNAAHKSLAELEKIGKIKKVITQNVDGLHDDAGNKKVIEFHGTYKRYICLKCGKKYNKKKVDSTEKIPKCSCGMTLKPDMTFFGENIPEEKIIESRKASEKSQIMLIIGTSAQVYPAANLPITAKKTGSKIIEINPKKTILSSYADYTFRSRSTTVLPRIMKKTKNLI